jgi:mannose-6-phosphate isomerase-like protein (cupin superfamily)
MSSDGGRIENRQGPPNHSVLALPCPFPSNRSQSPILTFSRASDNRLGVAEFTLPPHTSGPPAHWHEMHDETFLTTAGTVRFHLPGSADIDAAEGDFVTVPIRAPHTFSNPFDVEAKFVNTYSPAFYINYFKMLGEMIGDGAMTPQKNLEAMASFATLPVPKK